MIARHQGQIVLVGGAIPGERVVARVERVAKGVVHAQTASVEEPSADRRDPAADPLCGGCLYAHIEYARQLELKSDVIADAFSRIGRIPLSQRVAVRPSPTDGYRMRARLHARGGRVGFFREGTHDICDVRGTRQLLAETCDVVDRLAAGVRSLGVDNVGELELSENVSASERAVHIDGASAVDPRSLAALAPISGVTGLSFSTAERGPAALQVMSGDPHVSDTLSIAGQPITLKRHVLAFFQGNRYLLADLADYVVNAVQQDGSVIDLYAGAGLFALGAAALRGARVVAVEGDRVAAQDLRANAKGCGGAVEAVNQSVEVFTTTARTSPDTVIVDPPRTGMSKEAVQGVTRLRP